MVKINFTNNQTAFEYALYMIAGSYFDKAICKSQLIEHNMFIQYKEQRLDKQYQMEDICIHFMNDLVRRLPEKYFKQNMDVHLVRRKPGKPMQILFMSDEHIINVQCIYAGNKSKIDYTVWSR